MNYGKAHFDEYTDDEFTTRSCIAKRARLESTPWEDTKLPFTLIKYCFNVIILVSVGLCFVFEVVKRRTNLAKDSASVYWKVTV